MANPFGFLKYDRKDNRFVLLLNASWTLKNKFTQQKRQKHLALHVLLNSFRPQDNLRWTAVSGCPNDNLIPEWNGVTIQR